MKNRFLALLDEVFVMPRSATLLLVGGIGALATAFIAQYAFDEKPCILCLWQRIPFALMIAFAGLSLLTRHNTVLARRFLLLCAAVMLANAFIAFFHVGVEQHWWLGLDTCSIRPIAAAASAANLREALLSTGIARCDQISWTFLGLSMATWNVPFCLGISAFSFLAAFVEKTGRKLFAPKKETRKA